MLEETLNRALSKIGVGKAIANKKVLYSTLALLLFFFVYLLVNPIVQKKTVNDVYYVDKFLNLAILVGSNNSLLAAELELYRRGGKDRLQVDLPPIDTFLSPNKSYIEEVIGYLREEDIMAAAAAYDHTGSLLRRAKERSLDWNRYFQLGAANIAFLLFLLTILPAIQRLSKSKDDIDEDEAANGASTLSDGVFSIDKDFNIDGSNSSTSLRKMFGHTADLEGNFFSFIEQYLSAEVADSTRDYLLALSGENLEEEAQKDLNPLERVKIKLENANGEFQDRYLSMKFTPVIEEGEFSHLQASVKDESHRVQLEQELQKERDNQEAQLELLSRIQGANRELLDEFLTNANAILTGLSNTLSTSEDGNEIREEIEKQGAPLIDMKTEAGHFGFYKFESISHALYDELADLRLEKKIVEKNIEPSVLVLTKLVAELNNIRTLVMKYRVSAVDEDAPRELRSGAPTKETLESISSDTEAPILQLLAKTVSQNLGKRAKLVCYGMEPENIPESVDKLIHQTATQLVRNSIIHGCLSADERLEAGKTDYINICVRYSQKDGAHRLTVRDDGEGFNKVAIAKQALSQNLISQEQAEEIDSKQVLRLAFHPDFSNQSKNGGAKDNISLSNLRREIKEAGGRITLRHRFGEFCTFRVIIPK